MEVITSNVLRSPPQLGWLLWNICVTNDHRYVPLVVSTSRSFPHSWLITGFVTRLTRRVSLVEQKLFTLPGHLSSSPVFIGVRVTRSLVLYACFVNRCLSFCSFSFGHFVVCSSSICGFWLPLWYLYPELFLQILLLILNIVYHYRRNIIDSHLYQMCFSCLLRLSFWRYVWSCVFKKKYPQNIY